MNNDGRSSNHLLTMPELADLHENCGYCEKYLDKYNANNRCTNCPIRGGDYCGSLGCKMSSHPFSIWQLNKTKANAQAVLTLIKKS